MIEKTGLHNCLIVGSSSGFSDELIKWYRQFCPDRLIKFWGVSSSKTGSTNKFEKVVSYDDIGDLSDVSFNTVFVLASWPAWKPATKSEHHLVNQKILTALENIRFKEKSRIVFTSSFSVYGTQLLHIDDTSPTSPETPYAWAKLEMEGQLLNFCTINLLEIMILRLPTFLFRGVKNNFISKLADAAMSGGEYDMQNPNGKFASVTDAKHIALLTTKAINQKAIINCGSVPDITFHDIAEIAKINGLKKVHWKTGTNPPITLDLNTFLSLIDLTPSARNIISDWFEQQSKTPAV